MVWDTALLLPLTYPPPIANSGKANVKKRIFRAIVLLSLVILLCCLALVMQAANEHLRTVFMGRLDAQAHYLIQGIEQKGADYFRHTLVGHDRVSWIAPDGTILYDSTGKHPLPNHADREEIQEALKQGTGSSIRYSGTLGKQTAYKAFRLKDGSVLRLASTENSLWQAAWSMLPALLLAFAASMLLAAWLAGRIARKVVQPVNELDLEHPENAESYEELTPLLRRLAKQNAQIAAQIHELGRRQQEFEAITANMTEGLILLDAEGKILSCNAAAPGLVGLETLPTGSPLLALNREDPLREAVETAHKEGAGQALLHRHGRWVQIYANAARGKTGHLGGCVLLCVDVTEKEERDALRREFSANVSHELKTPLTTISGTAEMLTNGMVKTEDIPRFASAICEEAHRLTRLVDNIIRLSRLDETPLDAIYSNENEPVNLLILSRECLARLEKTARLKNIHLQASGDAALVLGVKLMLEEMIFNLCENAVKYNHDGGKVHVRVHAALTETSQVILEVSDTGIGVPLKYRERIFERFFRVDKSRSHQAEGSGLGLSIVRHIAKLHHAHIELESEEGKGTTVRIRFPAQACCR